MASSRTFDPLALLPDELFGIAERLSPSVQVRPAWWGFALIAMLKAHREAK
jgi:hypothetical protein